MADIFYTVYLLSLGLSTLEKDKPLQQSLKISHIIAPSTNFIRSWVDYREFMDMPLKRKILLPLSGISLTSPQHITLHLKQKCIKRVSPIQSTISCTVSLITYTVLLSVSCDDGVFSSELMTKTMGLSFHLCYKSYVSQTEVEQFSFKSGNHTHIW